MLVFKGILELLTSLVFKGILKLLTIPHSKLKDKLRGFVQLCFIKRNGKRRYQYLVLGRDTLDFRDKTLNYTERFTEYSIKMLAFFISNIFVMCGGHVFNDTVGISISAICCRLLDDLFIRMRQTSHRGVTRKTKKNQLASLILPSAL